MPCSPLVLGDEIEVKRLQWCGRRAFHTLLQASLTRSGCATVTTRPNATNRVPSSMGEDVLEVAYLPPPIPPSPQFPDSYQGHRGQGTPLIIDNGATTLRFGFCTSDSPKSGPSIISKYKDRKTNKPLVLFGDAIDTEPGARNQAKTPWEGDILLNFDALVSAWSAIPWRRMILDHVAGKRS